MTSRPDSDARVQDRHDPADRPDRQPRGLLAGMGVRRKLVFLHTLFSTALAAILLLALRPAIADLAVRAEVDQTTALLHSALGAGPDLELLAPEGSGVTLRRVPIAEFDPAGGPPGRPGEPWILSESIGAVRGAVVDPSTGDVIEATVISSSARSAVRAVYVLMILAVLGVYGLIAGTVELFVLPRHVYGPIRSALRADEAVRRGDRSGELIPAEMIPADELGAIMRSRNESIRKLRDGESQLADTLDRLESIAADLKRKNHLLENARKNLEGADRLRSLGMMSAGLAHELNTPLAVAKGLVEKLTEGRSLSDSELALLARVVGRLETLSDSLLDFARARSIAPTPTVVRGVAEEAATLVRLDRNTMPPGSGIEIVNEIPADLVVECEGDRMVQVFVNLMRNAVNAIRAGSSPSGRVTVSSSTDDRDGERWANLTITDTGPGIDPELLPTLFEPFVSTRLDAKGTGLGLAVAEGIVREHGGTLIARNRADHAGAVFEVMLPVRAAKLEPDRGTTE